MIDQLVPAEHLLRKIDAAVDFDRIYEMVDILYLSLIHISEPTRH